MARKLDYRWHLRQVMASRGMFATTDLIEPLAERGIHLSSSQVYRLVVERPERLSLKALMALLDILDCSLEELIEPVAAAAPARKATASGDDAGVGDLRPNGPASPGGRVTSDRWHRRCSLTRSALWSGCSRDEPNRPVVVEGRWPASPAAGPSGASSLRRSRNGRRSSPMAGAPAPRAVGELLIALRKAGAGRCRRPLHRMRQGPAHHAAPRTGLVLQRLRPGLPALRCLREDAQGGVA